MPKRRDHERAAERGFTLLETLVALTMLALSLTALMQAQRGSSGAIDRLGARLQAATLAESLLAEHVTRLDGLAPVTKRGALGNFSWTLRISPQPAERRRDERESGWQLYRADVDVVWPVGQHLHLATLKLGRTK
jgi:general secretion pathway protein I